MDSIALTYQNGQPVLGSDSWWWNDWEDVTGNVRTIKSVPLSQRTLEYRSARRMLYAKEIFRSTKPVAWRRRTWSLCQPKKCGGGSLRQLDPKIAAKRNLSVFLYSSPSVEELNVSTQEELLEKMAEIGFVTNPWTFKNAKRLMKSGITSRRLQRNVQIYHMKSTVW